MRLGPALVLLAVGPLPRRATCSLRSPTSRVLELRRAPVQSVAGAARSPTLDARLPLRVPVLVGDDAP